MNYEAIELVKEVESRDVNKWLKKDFYLIKQPVKIKRGDDETIIYVLAKFNDKRIFDM